MSDSLIVGIGASAGGLESLERFFSRVPEASGMAFVVIQHLSPDYKSLMDELLARHTKVTICQAEEGMRVEPNHIYLLPPKKEMILSDGALHLTDKDPKVGLSLPIDHFFRSLAQDAGRRAVAIVLSGTGSDGSRGIKDVHLAGGLVLSEAAASAAFDGMPMAALATGMVHHVLNPEDMPMALSRYQDTFDTQNARDMAVESDPLKGIEAVFDLLRREYDIDFSYYKPTTVSRRIERRLALINVKNLNEYAEHLRDHEDELDSLYKDLLIGVTQFFRDAEPFQRVEETIIPQILGTLADGEEIRVWVAGCATGEEPYSLAILFHEAIEKANRKLTLKIFATDVHKYSLEYAAHGRFDYERLKNIGEERLEKYFKVKENNQYQISQDIRQSIVFAQHNLLKDAPFTKLDLITCRNLLIYFQTAAQRKAISHFHFGLKTGGTLLLGSSETPGELSDEFETIHEHCKLYKKRRDIHLPMQMRMPLGIQPARLPQLPQRYVAKQTENLVFAYDHMLDRFMPPAILVNQNRELVECFSGAERFLRFQGRRPSADMVELLDTDDKTSIISGLARVMQSGKKISFSGVHLRHGEVDQSFNIEIEQIIEKRSGTRLFLLLLHPVDEIRMTDDPPVMENVSRMSKDMVANLEHDLKITKENLQATIEELQTSNEEMQATNEELVASNEELQSTNEELHSVNEELYSVNSEHQHKIRDLAELNGDIENLLQSTKIATIFLDHNLCIRKFTPQVTELFDLVDSDVGRRVQTFAHRLRHDGLVDDLTIVLSSGQPITREIATSDKVHYLLRILPYQVRHSTTGIVLSLIDISDLYEAKKELSRLAAIVQASSDAIFSVDAESDKVLTWNQGSQTLYGYTENEVIGKNVRSLLVPKNLRTEAAAVMRQVREGKAVTEVSQRLRKDGSTVHVSVCISPIFNEAGDVVAFASSSRDITDRRRLELLFRQTFDSTPSGMVLSKEDGVIQMANREIKRLFGYAADELEDMSIETLLAEPHRGSNGITPIASKLKTARTLLDEGPQLGRHRDGTLFPIEVGLSQVNTDEGVLTLTAISDITARLHATESLKLEIERREQFLAMLSHELRNPLSAVRSAAFLLQSSKSKKVTGDAVATINRQSQHMTRLLDDLLEISRMTQGRISLSLGEVDLRSVITEAVEAVEPLAIDHGITIQQDLPTDSVWVQGDQTRLEQIVTNVLANAVKFSDSGGQVMVRMRQDFPNAFITITDQGAGIDAEILAQIFDLFVQADATLDRSRGGIGVGLTLARKLTELHGGRIVARSEGVGHGSEFEIQLPLVRSPRRAKVKKPHFASIVDRSVKSVVLIEDQLDNRKMLSAMLDLKGVEVRDAGTGPAGLALIAERVPDVAIIDIGLPNMNGYEVASQVRQQHGDQIRLIALTGYGQQSDIDRATEAGFNFHLVKPLQPERLYELLELNPKRSSGKTKA